MIYIKYYNKKLIKIDKNVFRFWWTPNSEKKIENKIKKILKINLKINKKRIKIINKEEVLRKKIT